MISQVLILRFKQAFRLIRSTGFILIVLTFFAAIGMLLTALSNLLVMPAIWAVPMIMGVLLSIHVYRRDIDFLDTIADSIHEVRSLLFLEYILLSSPVLILHFYWGNFNVVLLSLLVISALSIFYNRIKMNQWRKSKSNLAIIPLEIFEIKFKIEQYPKIFLLIIIGSFLSFLHVAFLIVGLILFVLFIIDGFTASEPSEMIHWRPKFVWTKIVKSVSFFLFIFSFQSVIAVAFHPKFVWLVLYVFLAVSLLLMLIISYKYSTYNPIYSLSGSSNVLSIFILFSLLPGGVLVTLPFTIFHYLRSERNMTSYYA